MEKYEGATILGIDQHRWYVRIRVRLADDSETTLVASADSGVTYGDQVWFGTEDEYEEACR